jgi:hypothetical protein
MSPGTSGGQGVCHCVGTSGLCTVLASDQVWCGGRLPIVAYTVEDSGVTLGRAAIVMLTLELRNSDFQYFLRASQPDSEPPAASSESFSRSSSKYGLKTARDGSESQAFG